MAKPDQSQHLSKPNDCIFTIKAEEDDSVNKVEALAEIREESSADSDRRRQTLFLDIPSRSDDISGEDFVRINMPRTPSPPPKKVNFSPIPSPFGRMARSPGPSIPKPKTNIKNLLPKLSFKRRNSGSEIQNAVLLALESSPIERQERSTFSRTLSLTKLFGPRTKNNTSSLPVTPIARSTPESTHGGSLTGVPYSSKGGPQKPIHRSNSVPVLGKIGSLSVRSAFRVIPTTPRASEKITTKTSNKQMEDDTDERDIAEEEAVCRICYIELGEEGETFKLECHCKGELALAHKECAVKWFSIKGNKTCEVCKEEVQNLPVTLLRLQSAQNRNLRGSRALRGGSTQYRVWQDVPVLVIVSMLAYFCFLEQLLVGKMGSGAIAISLPFSCILGLMASITSTTMVRRKYVWVYATVQFALVVLSAHLLYSLLKMQGVLSVLLATFTGFGVTMCGNSFVDEISKWRTRWQAAESQPNTLQEAAESQLNTLQDRAESQQQTLQVVSESQPHEPSAVSQPTETSSQSQIVGDSQRDSDAARGN